MEASLLAAISNGTLSDAKAMAEIHARRAVFAADAELPPLLRARGIALFDAAATTAAPNARRPAVLVLRDTLRDIGLLYHEHAQELQTRRAAHPEHVDGTDMRLDAAPSGDSSSCSATADDPQTPRSTAIRARTLKRDARRGMKSPRETRAPRRAVPPPSFPSRAASTTPRLVLKLSLPPSARSPATPSATRTSTTTTTTTTTRTRTRKRRARRTAPPLSAAWVGSDDCATEAEAEAESAGATATATEVDTGMWSRNADGAGGGGV
ncbi:hypothetical protein ACN47E_009598 [Coniothyrium glycines]